VVIVVEARMVMVLPMNCCRKIVIGVKVVVAVMVTGFRPGTRLGGLAVRSTAGEMVTVGEPPLQVSAGLM
jgi:hypothetical protein